MKKPKSKTKKRSREINCCVQEYHENQMRLINRAERNAFFLELESSPPGLEYFWRRFRF